MLRTVRKKKSQDDLGCQARHANDFCALSALRLSWRWPAGYLRPQALKARAPASVAVVPGDYMNVAKYLDLVVAPQGGHDKRES